MSIKAEYHRNNPDIPSTWKPLGEGGNASVWDDGQYAVKRLKGSAGSESKSRFEKEQEILLALKDTPELAIVPLIEIRERKGATEIVMKKLGGNLSKRVKEFENRPCKAAAALIPIVETLAYLAKNEGIHHRDLKPENILTEDTAEGIKLYLGDFGCAYISSSDRLTLRNSRALGAWKYRPPEYCTGYIEKIDEKGDVFGLGKILWEMINGEPKVVFPSSLWFLEEFDLTRYYPNDSMISYAMLIIAKTSDHLPDRRPSLNELLEMLKKLSSNGSPMASNNESMELLRYEAIEKIKYEQRAAENEKFVALMYNDLKSSLEELAVSEKDSTILKKWASYYNGQFSHQDLEYYINQICVEESGACLYQEQMWSTRLVAQLRLPDGEKGISCFFSIVRGSSSKTLTFEVVNSTHGVLFNEFLGEDNAQNNVAYSRADLYNFVRQALSKIM